MNNLNSKFIKDYISTYFSKQFFINTNHDLYWKDFYFIDFSKIYLNNNNVVFHAQDSKGPILVKVVKDEIATQWQQVLHTEKNNILDLEFKSVLKIHWECVEILTKIFRIVFGKSSILDFVIKISFINLAKQSNLLASNNIINKSMNFLFESLESFDEFSTINYQIAELIYYYQINQLNSILLLLQDNLIQHNLDLKYN